MANSKPARNGKLRVRRPRRTELPAKTARASRLTSQDLQGASRSRRAYKVFA
jgi:hypothetical protein